MLIDAKPKQTKIIAPHTDIGTVINIINGSRKDSNCAANTK